MMKRTLSLSASPLLALLLLSLAACGGSKPGDAKSAEDVDEDSNPKTADTTAPTPSSSAPAPGSDDAKETAAAPAAGAADAPKKDECSVFDEANLESVLLKSSCEVPTPTGQPMDPKNLEVKATTSVPKVAPGSHVDVIVTFTNKSKAAVPLYFTIDPMPRFEIEAYNAKGNRVDLPKSSPPPLPAGMAARTPGEPKTARIMLAPNGTARMPLGWDAVKTKWAPEKLKGTPPEKGYPRSPAGSLPKGKYTLKIMTPLIGVFEGIDHEVSQPKAQLEIGK